MATRYEYRVCQTQQSKVTFVNGQWSGNRPMNTEKVDESLASCSATWDYLYDAGREGWEIAATSVIAQTPPYEVIYLRRILD